MDAEKFPKKLFAEEKTGSGEDTGDDFLIAKT